MNLQCRIAYVGYVIDGNGVSTDPAKVCVVQNWHVPTNLK